MIDPEFTVFAPPGLDVGSLMSGFVLAHLYHTQQGLPPAAAVPPGEEVQEGGPALELCAALRQLWASYEATLLAEGVSPAQLQRISEDSAGYAMMEVMHIYIYGHICMHAAIQARQSAGVLNVVSSACTHLGAAAPRSASLLLTTN